MPLDNFLRRGVGAYNRNKLADWAQGKALKIHDASLSPKTCVYYPTAQVLLMSGRKALEMGHMAGRPDAGFTSGLSYRPPTQTPTHTAGIAPPRASCSSQPDSPQCLRSQIPSQRPYRSRHERPEQHEREPLRG